MQIREARAEELDDVAALIQSAYAEYDAAFDRSDEQRIAYEEYRIDRADVRSRLDHSLLLVADDNGALLGTVTFYLPGSGEWPDGWAGIRLLGVEPGARGRGIGRALTEHCIERARALGAAVMGLSTTDRMAVARGMYERMGFVRAPEQDFYPSPETLVMGFRLDL